MFKAFYLCYNVRPMAILAATSPGCKGNKFCTASMLSGSSALPQLGCTSASSSSINAHVMARLIIPLAPYTDISMPLRMFPRSSFLYW